MPNAYFRFQAKGELFFLLIFHECKIRFWIMRGCRQRALNLCAIQFFNPMWRFSLQYRQWANRLHSTIYHQWQHSRLTLTNDVLWSCQVRESVEERNLNLIMEIDCAWLTSLISCADNAPGRSCLFASTNNVAPAKRSSWSRMFNSSRHASIRIRSAASTTHTRPSVLSK